MPDAKELAMSVFAVYLLYTWNYSGEKRVWNKKTISNYGHKSHLPYQLRAYRMLSFTTTRFHNLGEWCECGHVCTAEGNPIDKEFFEKTENWHFK